MPTLTEMVGVDSAMPQNQGNSSWLRQRIGYLTASNMKRVVVFSYASQWRLATDTVRTKYMQEIVAERMTDSAMDHYVTDAMQHGIDTELEALTAYEATNKVRIQTAEFILHPSIEYFGATPDGLVGHAGGVEVKCPTSPVYVAWRAANRIPEDHLPQIIANLLCTSRSWWDFYAFDPRIKHGPKGFQKRYAPSVEDLAWVASQAVEFLQATDRLFRRVTEQS